MRKYEVDLDGGKGMIRPDKTRLKKKSRQNVTNISNRKENHKILTVKHISGLNTTDI